MSSFVFFDFNIHLRVNEKVTLVYQSNFFHEQQIVFREPVGAHQQEKIELIELDLFKVSVFGKIQCYDARMIPKLEHWIVGMCA